MRVVCAPERFRDGGMGIQTIRTIAGRTVCVLAATAGLAATAAGVASAADPIACPATDICRADPFFVTPPASLGSPGAPDDDLLAALTDLKGAAAGSNAAKIARGRALAIIEGDPSKLYKSDQDPVADDTAFLNDKAYRGIPLLNTKAKVTDVPPGQADPTVDVTEVRYGDHALLDTSVLRFAPADMGRKFKISWHVTELGTSFGGELAPAGLPASGPAANATLQTLAPPPLLTGTQAHNRFHPLASAEDPGEDEETRIATQTYTVQMPAPNQLGGGILDPNLKAGHETFAQIKVQSTALPAPAPLPAAKVATASPVARIDAALTSDLPTDSTAFSALVDPLPGLVDSMRSRDTLPIPSLAAGANLGVAFANGEASVSKRGLRVAPGGGFTVALTNLDNVARDVVVRELRDRSHVDALGTLAWGAFTTDVVKTVHLEPGMSGPTIVPVTPASSAYSVWIGDPSGGDQAGTAIELDRGPRQQSLELGLGPVKPLHEAFDKRTGDLWVTMANADEVVRLHPTADAITSGEPEHFPLPGGAVPDPKTKVPPAPVLGPADVAIDARGIVWVTLTAANAIARIDPNTAKAGTTDGIDVIPLTPCNDGVCRQPPPPVAAAAPLTRLPLQLKVRADAQGNTDLFFTEQNADAIGELKFAPGSTKPLFEKHVPCVCLQPLGIALDPHGDVWYSEGVGNRIGRLTYDGTGPFGLPAEAPLHYNIPHPVIESLPGSGAPACGAQGEPACTPSQPGQPIQPIPAAAPTTLPHSVAIDGKGRVWYTGEASETVGYLDPAIATPNTSVGFEDTAGATNEFGRRLAPADLAIGPDGTAFIADEYGDQIGLAKIDEQTGAVNARFGFRPTARNSLTDSPMVDPHGNLWVVEGGANLITRITGVVPPAPAAPVPGTPPAAPVAAPAPAAPARPAQTPGKSTCAATSWLVRRGSGRRLRRTLPLLGMSAAAVQRCFGKPVRTARSPKVETWTYAKLSVRFSRGKVDAFTLLRAALPSAPDRAGIGASVASFRTALGTLVRAGRGYRGVVAVGAKDAADVRLTVRRGRVTRVAVTTKKQAALDRAGLRLLGRAR